MARSPISTGRNILKALEGILGVLFNTENLTPDSIIEIENKAVSLVKNIEVEIERVRSFQFDPKWKQRVINVPAAVNAIKSLVEELTTGVKDNISTIFKPFTNAKAQWIAFLELAKAPPEPGESGLLRGYQEIQQFIDLLNSLIGEIDSALTSAANLQGLFDRVINDMESLEDIFLQQGNRRKIEKLDSGGDIKIRLGNLHEE